MEDSSRLRRKDTTKGPPLRILSLDGGGVRGYSIFIILQELMHRTFVEIEGRAPKRHEIPKPADYFDLIVGTGTGGLIAIMLGRLRLDIDTCKDVYVRMTRRVFETDKTIAGIPYKSTLFKASKLEEAIRDCVREHTVFEDEGNDVLANATPMTPASALSRASADFPSRTLSQSSRYSQVGMSPITAPRNFGTTRWGNANALLYDTRENRTKTAVLTQFAGKRSTGNAVLLRSYDSRKEPAPDVNCTIWQAGRATSAIGLAFKPIQIGQSVYHDDGSGKFNPAPQVLDEALLNEWPGREVGVFVSIGTGKRPSNTGQAPQHEWFESFVGGSMGEFAQARRKLAQKIEACEDTHQYMLHEHLAARHVNVENYFRLNVEVGVGEFGMNEWNRLSDISTSTRLYLSKHEVQSMNLSAAAKMARIHFARVRHERAEVRRNLDGLGSTSTANTRHSWQNPWDARPSQSYAPPSNPMAVELPASEPYKSSGQGQGQRPQYEHRPSVADQKYTVVSNDDQYPEAVSSNPSDQQQQHPYSPPRHASNPSSSPYNSPSYLSASRPMQSQSQDTSPRPSGDGYSYGRSSGEVDRDRERDGEREEWRPPVEPPPLPPKTPLQHSKSTTGGGGGLPYPQDRGGDPYGSPGGGGPRTFVGMGELGRAGGLPYPDAEGPPPTVNLRSKPTISR